MGRWIRWVAQACIAGLSGNIAALSFAQAEGTYGLYGDVGLIDMPTARMAEDGFLTTGIATFDSTARTTLNFQITPRLTGSFRYTTVDNFFDDGSRIYDRSFDLKYQILTEGLRWPSLAVGLRDFIGTGLLTSEYIVASKTLSPKLTVSAGMGWGRLGSYQGFDNPLGIVSDSFDTRPTRDVGLGGEVEADQFFRGNAALFGGLEYRFNDTWTGKLEYSSDAYTQETGQGSFERNSPFNAALVYSGFRGVELAAYALHGSRLGVSASFITDPKRPAAGPGRDPAPLPVKISNAAQSWAPTLANIEKRKARLAKLLETEGQIIESFAISGDTARVRVRNTQYRATAQAVGRTARAMSHAMPGTVRVFEIVPVENGQPLSQIVIARQDLERLENKPDAIALSYAKADIQEADLSEKLSRDPELYPKLSYGLAPYLSLGLFDPDTPIRADFGVSAQFDWSIAPGLSFSGEARGSLFGNFSEGDVDTSPSPLPRVRSNADVYNKEGNPYVRTLALNYLFRPVEETYGRVTLGYLERAYAGLSAEVLWKPVDSKLALGGELNYVYQRAFDGGFGLQDYNVVTGHVSAYYPLGENFHAQVDVGRYLAGDYGTTLSLDREFANGWRVGAFATFTDVSAEDFGEGSFDKGIQITGPLDWILGRPNKSTVEARVRSLSRDGGARLRLDNRLYDTVRDGHAPDLKKSWGRFWK
ncbi:MAG: YjbH domain-containing protein [Pseudomonadota bacterium]